MADKCNNNKIPFVNQTMYFLQLFFQQQPAKLSSIAIVIIIINETLNILGEKVELLILLFFPILVSCMMQKNGQSIHTSYCMCTFFLLQFYGYLSQQQNMMQVQMLLLSCTLFASLCYYLLLLLLSLCYEPCQMFLTVLDFGCFLFIR